jgi:hypothetical protein
MAASLSIRAVRGGLEEGAVQDDSLGETLLGLGMGFAEGRAAPSADRLGLVSQEDIMSRTTIISTLAVATALAGAGCFRAPDAPGIDGDWSTPTPDYGYTSSAITVENGSQSGDMGSILRFSGAATNLGGYGDSYSPSYSNIRLDSTGSDWWVMSAINISGDLAGPGFAPGTHRTFSGVYDGGDSVSVTGCSGPELGNYTFDAPSNDVEITVQSLPSGMRRMDYVVRFSDGAVTQGSFDYRIEGEASGTTRSGI